MARLLVYGLVNTTKKNTKGAASKTEFSGSALHAVRTLASPRWEDYEYERVDKTHNRLGWLGSGQTENERTMTGDCASQFRFQFWLARPR
jgi:hypothetical protein